MCDPVSIGIAAAGVATAGAVMGFEGQRQAYGANEKVANQQAAQGYNQLQEQNAQIDAQQSENTVSAMIDRAKGEGSISAYAGSFGLGGATSDRLANAVDFEAGRSLSIENLNSQSQHLQTHEQLLGTQIERQNKINQVSQANPLSLVLGIAKAGLQGVGAYTSAGGTFGGTPKGGSSSYQPYDG